MLAVLGMPGIARLHDDESHPHPDGKDAVMWMVEQIHLPFGEQTHAVLLFLLPPAWQLHFFRHPDSTDYKLWKMEIE